MRMNPFAWKTQHKIALLGFMTIGALIGAIVGNYLAFLLTKDLGIHPGDALYDSAYDRFMLAAGIAGAAVSGVIVYLIQMLRT